MFSLLNFSRKAFFIKSTFTVRKKTSVKTRISKTFYTQKTSCFFRFWLKTEPRKWKAETVLFRSGHLRTVYFSRLSNLRQEHFFAPTLCKLCSIFCRRYKSTRDLRRSHSLASRASFAPSALTQSTCAKSIL